jgi:hypothetical protein
MKSAEIRIIDSPEQNKSMYVLLMFDTNLDTNNNVFMETKFYTNYEEAEKGYKEWVFTKG